MIFSFFMSLMFSPCKTKNPLHWLVLYIFVKICSVFVIFLGIILNRYLFIVEFLQPDRLHIFEGRRSKIENKNFSLFFAWQYPYDSKYYVWVLPLLNYKQTWKEKWKQHEILIGGNVKRLPLFWQSAWCILNIKSGSFSTNLSLRLKLTFCVNDKKIHVN